MGRSDDFYLCQPNEIAYLAPNKKSKVIFLKYYLTFASFLDLQYLDEEDEIPNPNWPFGKVKPTYRRLDLYKTINYPMSGPKDKTKHLSKSYDPVFKTKTYDKLALDITYYGLSKHIIYSSSDKNNYLWYYGEDPNEEMKL